MSGAAVELVENGDVFVLNLNRLKYIDNSHRWTFIDLIWGALFPKVNLSPDNEIRKQSNELIPKSCYHSASLPEDQLNMGYPNRGTWSIF